VPPGQTLPWAVGVVRTSDEVVPVLDVDAVGSRLVEGGTAQ
jgi:hypothetical protein